MKIGAKGISIVLVVSILGSVALLSLFGLWKTESEKTPIKFSSGEFAGMSNPADIRGSYSFADVASNFSVTAETLAKAFAFDTSEKKADAYLAKDLEAAYGEVADGAGEVGTDSLKWFVSLYTGLPYVPAEDTYLPRSAIDLLQQEGKIDTAKRAELELRAVDPLSSHTGTVPVPTEHVESSDERLIKGNTTYADVISWGVSQQQIEEVLGMPIGSKTANIRDHLLQNNLSFSTIKAQLQALVPASGE